MSHPTFWPKIQKTFYYPIGNTPPICLSDHLPPEAKNATVLLLGCGDPRNILYTISVDNGPPTRIIDFTCCDLEPAIIARNILLITLIADGVDAARLSVYWSIFYDMFIDMKAASLLKDQCSKLVKFAADMTTWTDSTYGSFVKFSTQETLNEARRHWFSYVETLTLSESRQEQLKATFLSRMKAHSNPAVALSSVPSAAPLCFNFSSLAKQAYSQYWKTGVTNPSVTSTTPTQINPTFLFSAAGRQFHVHFGTDPCAAFHLALPLTEITFEDGSSSKPGKTVREIWDACFRQFDRWTTSFHRRLQTSVNGSPSIVIHFVFGDALAFCDGLQLCKTGDFTPCIYSSSWGGAKFSFHDRTMPTSFDVVDTSNLSDSIGLLNLLVAAAPLLKRSPFSVLNTSSLLAYNSQPTTKRSAIEERAILNFPSISLLLGIAPVCFSSGLSFQNSCDAANFSAIALWMTRHYERVTWKFSEYTHARWSGTLTQRNHKVHYPVEDFSNKLFGVYLKMFDGENVDSISKHMESRKSSNLQDEVHYNRHSFVRLLQAIRSMNIIETDWDKTMLHFMSRLVTDKDKSLYTGCSNNQALLTDLHLLGISTIDLFFPSQVATAIGAGAPPFQTWKKSPPVVCLVLRVPRPALKAFEELTKVGENLVLEGGVFSDTGDNFFGAIRPIFGNICESGRRKLIVEDPDGSSGNSPLIVSFFVPSWLLTNQPCKLRVGLGIKPTLGTIGAFTKTSLCSKLDIYSTNLFNHENVSILPERPDNPGELQRRASMNVISAGDGDDGAFGMTAASYTKGVGEVLSRNLSVTDPKAKTALLSKASVNVKQTTPFCMKISIDGRYHYSLYYPIPVDGTRSEMRIGRLSSNIELDVPPRHSPLSQRKQHPFSLTLAAKGVRPPILSWNAPYVNLDRLPIISFSENVKWLDKHLGFCMTREERRLFEARPAVPEKWGPSLNFRVSLRNILYRRALGQHKAFFVHIPNRLFPYAVIVISCIRHDMSSATIVGDAVVIFTNTPIKFHAMTQCLEGNAMITEVESDEIHWWSHALPAFVERCRQWDHLPTCEYLEHQCVPSSTEYEKPPICSCGKGKNLGPFQKNKKWKEFAPHATRIALSPIFPVTYFEDVTEPAEGGPNYGEVSVLSKLLATVGSGRRDHSDEVDRDVVCERCRGAGKPKLLNCSRCKLAQYCSKDCQLADWKKHKSLCNASGKQTR